MRELVVVGGGGGGVQREPERKCVLVTFVCDIILRWRCEAIVFKYWGVTVHI